MGEFTNASGGVYVDAADYYRLADECDQWRDVALEWEKNAATWERRAELAKNLALDLRTILKALRKRGLLHLEWSDASAAKWHGLPRFCRDYILNE